MKNTVQESIDVEVPVREAYDLWTRFEDFPSFMGSVDRVEQLDDRRLRWVVTHAGREHEWIAEITEQEPDQRIAWREVEGKENAGVVTFHRLDDQRTRVTLQLDRDPQGALETLGEKLGFDERMAADNLRSFRDRLHELNHSPHGWRGEIEQDATG